MTRAPLKPPHHSRPGDAKDKKEKSTAPTGANNERRVGGTPSERVPLGDRTRSPKRKFDPSRPRQDQPGQVGDDTLRLRPGAARPTLRVSAGEGSSRPTPPDRGRASRPASTSDTRRGSDPRLAPTRAAPSASSLDTTRDDRLPSGKRAPPSTGPKGAPPASARALAIEVLARVSATDAYLNVVLDAALDEFKLPDPRDAGLVTELCYGTARRQITLDYALAQYLDRDISQIEDKVLAALRLGAYQLFFSRVPKHAAVADTVQALKQVGLDRASGFVNALLRKLSALAEPPLPDGTIDPDARLEVQYSHPRWLIDRWRRQYGPERLAAVLDADNQPPDVVIRTNTSRTTRDALLAEMQAVGIAATPTLVSPIGIVLPGSGRVDELYGFAEGLWQVQDEAAQLVGLYAAIPPNAKVLDACAAPGGKACHQAETHQVLAIDLHRNKLHKILAEARRLQLTDRLKVDAIDASKLPERLGEFDAVLVDAPCSGLGTLRRHPELRYRRIENDLPRLASLQRAILESCQAHVSPGGLLVYAVCTTEPQEGADQIEMFLRSHPDFTAEAPTSTGIAFPTWQGHLRTLPGPEGMDGFFAARLRRLY